MISLKYQRVRIRDSIHQKAKVLACEKLITLQALIEQLIERELMHKK